MTRSADAFQITSLTTTPWTPQAYQAEVMAICADHGKMWQAVKLLRDSIQWARDRRAVGWNFSTETQYDLAPIMKRLGAVALTPRYRLDLKSKRNGRTC